MKAFQKFHHEKQQQDKMAATSNKRTIHYQEGEGESNLPFENHQAESKKTKGCN